MKKLMNGNLVDMTPDEISAKQAEEAQTLIDVQNKEKAIADAEANASSGKQKLKDLGLNDAEIKALIGV
tara:strand:- start:44 stop:250 length:207 start_codon:yes stop_codon:yes gene_type:complete